MDDLRQRILGASDAIAPGSVAVPEWGGATVYIRRLTLTERLAFEIANGALEDIDRLKSPGPYVRWLVRYVILTACQADGSKIFEPDDETALTAKAGTSVERVAIAALRMNTVTAQEIAAMGKPSGGAPNGASPSDSQAISASR